jgi:hypothetical protein
MEWQTFDEAAKLLTTNFRGCQNESFKAKRLSDKMRALGDDGVWALIDASGDRWAISQIGCENISEMKRLCPGYVSDFDD